MTNKYFLSLLMFSLYLLSRSLEGIKDSINCFKSICQIKFKCIKHLKIDSISVVVKREARVEDFPEDIFLRKYHKRFPAITIKHKKLKISGNIFPKCLILMGLKSLSQIDLFMKYIV